MDLRQLQYMLTVAECRSVTKAAEKLFISQSALSHYIKNAETELGMPIFDRTAIPISLTYAGELYMESAQKILLEASTLEKQIRDISEHMTGRLVLGTSRDRASYTAPLIIPRFKQMYPDINLTLRTDGGKALMNILREGGVDLVYLPDSEKKDEKGALSEFLYSEEMVIAAKPGYIPDDALDETKSYIKIEALDRFPFIVLEQGRVTRDYLENFFQTHGLQLNILMEMNSNSGCFRMATAGMGIAMLPVQTIKLSHSVYPAALYRIGDPSAKWLVNCYYRKGTYLGKPERALIELIKETFSNETLASISEK